VTAYIPGLVVRAPGAPAELAELHLPEIGPGQVRVLIRAAGVCHSDLSMVNGTLAPPHPHNKALDKKITVRVVDLAHMAELHFGGS